MKELINVPNFLTSLRLVLATPLVYFIISDNLVLSISIIILALATEIDGTIARRFGTVSKFGAIYDRFADSVFILSGMVTLIVLDKLSLTLMLVFVAITVLRIVVVWRLKYMTGRVLTTFWSKLAVFLVLLIIPLAILNFSFLPELIIITIAYSIAITLKRIWELIKH